jgi:plastocyanin
MNIILILLNSYKTILLLLVISGLMGIASAKTFDFPIKKINYQSKYNIHLINFDTAKRVSEDHHSKIKHNGKGEKTRSGSAAKESAPESIQDNTGKGLLDQNIIIPPDALLNNFHFDQQQLNVPIGATVNWDNHDSTDHNLQVFRIVPGLLHYEPYGSKDLSPFDTLTVQFKQPGEYAFQCISPNHNNMTGTIFVS